MFTSWLQVLYHDDAHDDDCGISVDIPDYAPSSGPVWGLFPVRSEKQMRRPADAGEAVHPSDLHPFICFHL